MDHIVGVAAAVLMGFKQSSEESSAAAGLLSLVEGDISRAEFWNLGNVLSGGVACVVGEPEPCHLVDWTFGALALITASSRPAPNKPVA